MPKTPIDMQLDGVTWMPVVWETEPDDSLPYPTHEGTLEVMGFTFRCYQLNDGRRVIDSDDMARFFGGLMEPHPSR